MKNVLILGSNSFTGHYICQLLGIEYELITCNRSGIAAQLKFDIFKDSLDTLDKALAQADVVINCISNGDLDACEQDPENSTVINFGLVKALCAKQIEHGFHLIHFSSNAVYDGENALYDETSPLSAINRYGNIKIAADQYIQTTLNRYTILRPITMYGIRLGDQRHNPFSFFYQQLLNNRNIDAVDDVYTNMLYVEDLIHCIRSAINRQAFGVYNISGDDVVNRYEFVSIIRSAMPHSQSLINRVTSKQFKTIAKRARDTSFDNTKMKSELGVHPRAIAETINRLLLSEQQPRDQEQRYAS